MIRVLQISPRYGPGGDARSLAQAMKYFLEKPGLRESLAKVSAGRAAKHFDVKMMTTAYEDLYETILGTSVL